MRFIAIGLLQTIKKKSTIVSVLFTGILFPMLGIAQTEPGGPGGLPEEVVPFDDNMNLVFLVAGVLFAAFIVYKRTAKKITS
ncbi:MAG: hypothetical protein RL172_1898 [Bacteroidota bacterium]|jgi:hypothetical protein